MIKPQTLEFLMSDIRFLDEDLRQLGQELGLVPDTLGKSKRRSFWDHITLPQERINAAILAGIAKFNAENNK